MRILIVGGEDGHLRQSTYEYLLAKGHVVAIAGPVEMASVSEIGCEVLQYTLNPKTSLISDLKSIKELRQLIKSWKPEIIHAFDSKPNYLMPLACIGIKHVRRIRTINGLGKLFSSISVKKRLLRIIYYLLHFVCRGLVDLTIFQNKTDMHHFVSKHLTSNEKSILIPGSGIDTDMIEAHSAHFDREKFRIKMGWHDRFVFILISRLIREKGVLEFIQAALKISEEIPQGHFVLVGPADGDFIGNVDLRKLYFGSGHISYLGMQKDVISYLKAADVFVLPTKYREGIPRVLLEAMSVGKPIIVSDVPGCGEIVEKADCGIVIPAGDVDLLCNAMKTIVDADTNLLGERSRQAVQTNYSTKIIMKLVENEYIKIQSKHKES